MECPTIDFNDADRATQSIPIQQNQEYQSRTIREHNKTRYLYLPSFPLEHVPMHPNPLLANVPCKIKDKYVIDSIPLV